MSISTVTTFKYDEYVFDPPIVVISVIAEIPTRMIPELLKYKDLMPNLKNLSRG